MLKDLSLYISSFFISVLCIYVVIILFCHSGPVEESHHIFLISTPLNQHDSTQSTNLISTLPNPSQKGNYYKHYPLEGIVGVFLIRYYRLSLRYNVLQTSL